MKSSTQFKSGDLEHAGVKGMKWGVRKDRKSTGSGSGTKTKLPSNKASDISDADLKAAVARMNLERDYARLMKERADANKSGVQKATDFVLKSLGDAAKQQVDSYVKNRVSKIVADLRKPPASGG